MTAEATILRFNSMEEAQRFAKTVPSTQLDPYALATNTFFIAISKHFLPEASKSANEAAGWDHLQAAIRGEKSMQQAALESMLTNAAYKKIEGMSIVGLLKSSGPKPWHYPGMKPELREELDSAFTAVVSIPVEKLTGYSKEELTSIATKHFKELTSHSSHNSLEMALGVADTARKLLLSKQKTEGKENKEALLKEQSVKWCNRPECPHFRKESDKVMQCAKCKMVAYCNKECQTGHWLTHKKVCKKSKS